MGADEASVVHHSVGDAATRLKLLWVSIHDWDLDLDWKSADPCGGITVQQPKVVVGARVSGLLICG